MNKRNFLKVLLGIPVAVVSGKAVSSSKLPEPDSIPARLLIRNEPYDHLAEVRAKFKEGDWVFGYGDNKGCSEVFVGDNNEIQPFSYLDDYNPDNFELASMPQLEKALKKLNIHGDESVQIILSQTKRIKKLGIPVFK